MESGKKRLTGGENQQSGATPTRAHLDADLMLAALAVTGGRAAALKLAIEEELAHVKEKYGPELQKIKEQLGQQKKLLESHMKRHRRALFGTAAKTEEREDYCDLPHGRLLRSLKRQVVKARGVLEELERLGLDEGLRRTVEVDWEALAAWPDEKLLLVGAERRMRETLTWELTKERGGGPPEE